jgi:allophanate hydrolase subunit 2
MKSHAVFPGVIQAPDTRTPIVLMADTHTTGGYPRIATVIAADQWRLAQAPPSESLRFSLCTRTDAIQAWQQQQTSLQDLRRNLHAH